MSVPGIVQSQLDGEQVAAQVSLGGEDTLFVTPSRTLIYRADGLLSDESVEAYPHDAERIEISEGRRKSAIELDYGIEGAEKFKIPTNRLYEALHPVLAGVLNAADVTGSDETVKQTYQFSELTLVVTSERVVKHVGAAVWDQDYEEFRFAEVTGLDVEEGNVSSQIIIEADGRPERIKTPSDQTREVRERIERALLDYHGAASYEEFARQHADPADDADAEAESDDADSTAGEENDPLAGGVDPIGANPPELDDDGAIIEDDASVKTAGNDADDSTAADTADAAETAIGSVEASPADSANSGVSEVSVEDSASPTDGASSADTASTTDTASSTDDASQTVGSESERLDVEATAASEATDESETVAETDGFADSGFEPASSDSPTDDTDARLEALTEAVERQNELLAKQQRTLETLVDELSRGR